MRLIYCFDPIQLVDDNWFDPVMGILVSAISSLLLTWDFILGFITQYENSAPHPLNTISMRTTSNGTRTVRWWFLLLAFPRPHQQKLSYEG